MQTLAGTVIDDVVHNLCKIKQFWGLQVGTCKGNVERVLMHTQKWLKGFITNFLKNSILQPQSLVIRLKENEKDIRIDDCIKISYKCL